MTSIAGQSWVEGANDADGDFSLANLPMGVVAGEGRGLRIGVRIGAFIVDCRVLVEAGFLAQLDEPIRSALTGDSLNAFMSLGRGAWRKARAEMTRLLGAECAELRDHPQRKSIMLPEWGMSVRLPCTIGDYSDFYASLNHATNVGSMFRPDNPLLPNWKHMPIGYHGRASSIVATGTPIRRPSGQTVSNDAGPPTFGPTKLLDYELEVGALIGTGNALGEPITVDCALENVFGLVLLNDWSARDLQKWEYQPLGPFLAKNFASTLSGWVVSVDALEPYRVPLPARPTGDPEPLAYLRAANDVLFDVHLEVSIASSAMRSAGTPATRISRGNFKDMYWTIAQMIAHHTSSGCNLRPGDLLASGTVSGASPDSRGCLLERTWRGSEPITLGDGTERKFLQDGDEVIMRAWCERDGLPRIGFGACRGIITPAR
ncbi:MAG: fumarylacetoacetase [Phycisphaerales bacterium]|nr:fumarylacetoacetase [Phycisphaerales bacterium]